MGKISDYDGEAIVGVEKESNASLAKGYQRNCKDINGAADTNFLIFQQNVANGPIRGRTRFIYQF